MSLPVTSVSVPWWRRRLGLRATGSTVLAAMTDHLPIGHLHACGDGRLPKELLAMEERQVIRSYKFGLAYLAPGQTTESEMLANNWPDTSPAFRRFLDFLGQRIPLRGWRGYRGGLDVHNGHTGEESVHTAWKDYEIMFHVAPLLPAAQVPEAQQIERKRHLGNDIVLILFQDSDTSPFLLDSIRSKQNHIICIVQPHPSGGYRFSIYRRKQVPIFEPYIPLTAVLSGSPASRDFFFHKLIAGERASYRTPAFSSKIGRTRSAFLHDLATQFIS